MSKRWNPKKKRVPQFKITREGISFRGTRDELLGFGSMTDSQLKKGPLCKCMYCEKEYKFGAKERNPKCCNACRKIRDWCKYPNCEKKSSLVTGYPPLTSKQQEKRGGMIALLPPISHLSVDWEMKKENQALLDDDPWHLMNHCTKHFHELIGAKPFTEEMEKAMADYTFKDQRWKGFT